MKSLIALIVSVSAPIYAQSAEVFCAFEIKLRSNGAPNTFGTVLIRDDHGKVVDEQRTVAGSVRICDLEAGKHDFVVRWEPKCDPVIIHGVEMVLGVTQSFVLDMPVCHAASSPLSIGCVCLVRIRDGDRRPLVGVTVEDELGNVIAATDTYGRAVVAIKDKSARHVFLRAARGATAKIELTCADKQLSQQTIILK